MRFKKYKCTQCDFTDYWASGSMPKRMKEHLFFAEHAGFIKIEKENNIKK